MLERLAVQTESLRRPWHAAAPSLGVTAYAAADRFEHGSQSRFADIGAIARGAKGIVDQGSLAPPPSPAVPLERDPQFSSRDTSVGVYTKLSWCAESSGLATCGAISSFCGSAKRA